MVLAGFLPILADMFKETDLYIRQQLALCFKYCAGMVRTIISSHICEIKNTNQIKRKRVARRSYQSACNLRKFKRTCLSIINDELYYNHVLNHNIVYQSTVITWIASRPLISPLSLLRIPCEIFCAKKHVTEKSINLNNHVHMSCGTDIVTSMLYNILYVMGKAMRCPSFLPFIIIT